MADIRKKLEEARDELIRAGDRPKTLLVRDTIARFDEYEMNVINQPTKKNTIKHEDGTVTINKRSITTDEEIELVYKQIKALEKSIAETEDVLIPKTENPDNVKALKDNIVALQADADYLAQFVPAPPVELTVDELKVLIQRLIDGGASNPGQIFGALKNTPGVNNKLAAPIVKELLQ